MATRERPSDRGTRVARRHLAAMGAEIRSARVGAGLSLAAVGRAVGLSYSQVGRIERAVHVNPTVLQLARICATVGLDLSVRAFPGPSPLRDAGQVVLLTRLQGRIGVGIAFDAEVAMPIPGDLRAWDAMLTRGAEAVAVEAETRLNDVQATLRRIALKQRDSSVERVLLVVADTRQNRAAVRAAGALLDETFPVHARVALADLKHGVLPSGSALIFL